MAFVKKESKTTERADSTPWKVVGTDGKQVGRETYPGYHDAQVAARRYTLETGIWAGTCRV